jgi:peptide-methionine (R)-S-oxide reductase
MKTIILAVLLSGILSCSYSQKHDRMKTSAIHNDTGQYPIQKSHEEWKKELDDMQYRVLREAATERPFSGRYYNTTEAGIYYSAATGQPLFASDAKYDSSCGWPSFFEPITKEAILYRRDNTHGMIRTEIIDSSSGSHLGHVFDDGPPPTGLRYCMNSASMVFVGIHEQQPPLVKEYMEKYASEEEQEAVGKFLSNY